MRGRSWGLLLVPALCLIGLPAAGQTSGGTVPATGGTTQPAGTTTGSRPVVTPPPTTFPRPAQEPSISEMPRPIYLSGQVRLDEGTPPPSTVVIESVCGSTVRAEAYTDSKGGFAFQLGDKNNGVMQDASMGSPLSQMGGFGSTQTGGNPFGQSSAERLLMNCELRAVLPGYQSAAISLAARRFMDNPDLGTIIMHRIGRVEGVLISAKSLAAPKDARKAFEKSTDAEKKNKPDEAYKELTKAVQIYPDYAEAWFALGKLQVARNQLSEARQSFETAIQRDPKFLEPYLRLAGLQAAGREWESLVGTTESLLRLDPYDYTWGYFLNAVANFNLRNLDAAEKSVRQAQKMDSPGEYPRTWQLLGLILANRQQYPEAASALRQYLVVAPQGPDADAVREQLAQIDAEASATER